MKMTRDIRFDCPHCKSPIHLSIEFPSTENSFACNHCQGEIKISALDDEEIPACPVCHCSHLYQQKDFNRTVGLSIFFIGVILSFVLHPLWIVAALLIDIILYPLYPWILICYKCACELRGWIKQKNRDRFHHDIGASYEYREEKKQMNQSATNDRV